MNDWPDEETKPSRTYAPMLTVRCTREFRVKVNEMAAKERMSTQAFCERAIAKELKRKQKA